MSSTDRSDVPSLENETREGVRTGKAAKRDGMPRSEDETAEDVNAEKEGSPVPSEEFSRDKVGLGDERGYPGSKGVSISSAGCDTGCGGCVGGGKNAS